eukprot:1008455-Amorphochlora_amoeboformis.AAC.1
MQRSTTRPIASQTLFVDQTDENHEIDRLVDSIDSQRSSSCDRCMLCLIVYLESENPYVGPERLECEEEARRGERREHRIGQRDILTSIHTKHTEPHRISQKQKDIG